MAALPPAAPTGKTTPARYAAVPLDDDHAMDLPRAPYLSEVQPESSESPRGSYIQRDSYLQTPGASQTLLPAKVESESDPRFAHDELAPQAKRRRLLPLAIGLLALVIIVLAVILPVYFTVIKPHNNKASSAAVSPHSTGPVAPNSSGAAPTSTPVVAEAISGGDGSTVKATDGTTFIYNNTFGGIWYSDPNDPYNTAAFPNSWSPPLNQSWDYTNDRIYGVNLGGWFVLEPFIAPALFQKYPGTVDEWTLSEAMRADKANGGINQIEDHYKTFITEQDFAQIAAAGLNWIRLPIPYWAIDVWDDEPFLAQVSWPYIVQAFQWARKYGLRIMLDLHTIPGSQNGFNHSGRLGSINFLLGTMGMANAQRALNYIRIITEFISQPEYRDVIPMFGILNEPVLGDNAIGTNELRGFYVEVYKMIRGITGIGEGKGPAIAIHDSFQTSSWAGFMTGADRVVLDTHQYFAFNGAPNTDPIDTGTGPGAGGTWPDAACNGWTPWFNTSRNTFGPTVAGEWSNGFNDCGLFLTGVGGSQNFGGNCADWQDASKWNAGTKAGIKALGAASMDALIDWFFWTWRVGESQRGIVESPLWSYKAGLAGGWILTDPRQASGACGPPSGDAFTGYQPWMTGGAGAGDIAAAQTKQYPYPPTDLQGTPVAPLPVYTSTGSIITLPVPTFTGTNGAVIGTANGWFNTNDAAPAPTKIPGCAYPSAWDAQNAAIPTGCTGGPNAALPAAITPPPRRR
ncbi:hypothetical protein D9619_013626 [Psilocybe cf. subviscida]|uniref:glucan 1,3-beta-glucosidase n=1 Tax=Psilocybe cf. subviscida TaxID=2480587 RepID=A0A8H5BTI4_9AGAR|nr:hypothetical protein D9619_013626 [Psilocybe cf. subviscida]